MSWRGIFAGSLALIALQAVVSSRDSAGRVGSGLEWIADLVSAALDPGTPAIPDLAGVSYDAGPEPGTEGWGEGKKSQDG
ncbi:hypothetical protein JOE61_003857 [Nocardioides salarius]|uniref:Uncharacterized protein n=1 Tax=Nocardioides salarius TaxID=374513 RepID=A0ABS2MFS2_9ACTN|nr:hypothetical protein [Nocardioides salarius]MBM7510043.1 hypothetical protein [Nocardioides salarius]